MIWNCQWNLSLNKINFQKFDNSIIENHNYRISIMNYRPKKVWFPRRFLSEQCPGPTVPWDRLRFPQRHFSRCPENCWLDFPTQGLFFYRTFHLWLYLRSQVEFCQVFGHFRYLQSESFYLKKIRTNIFFRHGEKVFWNFFGNYFW